MRAQRGKACKAEYIVISLLSLLFALWYAAVQVVLALKHGRLWQALGLSAGSQ